MWFAGPSGLARYDGARMTSIGQKEGLSSTGLRCLGTHGDSVVVGTDNGVDLVAANRTISPIEFGGAKPGFVQSVVTIGSMLLIGGSRGLFGWTPTSSIASELPEAGLSGQLVADLVVDGNGRIWACGPGFGVKYADNIDGPWHFATTPTLSAMPRLFPLSRGALVTSRTQVVQLFGDGSSAPLALYTDVDVDAINVVWCDRAGLWIGGPSGLSFAPRDDNFTIDASAHEILKFGPAEVVLSNVSVTDISIDADRNVWVATDANGVARLSVMRNAFRRPIPSTAPVMCIKPAARGFLVGCEGEVWRLPNATGRRAGQPAELLPVFAGQRVWDIHETAPGQIWAATQEGTFVSFATQNGPMAMPPIQLGNHKVLSAPGRALLEVDARMWIGTLEGLALVESDNLDHVTEVTEPSGASLGYVYSLVQTSNTQVAVACLGNGLWWVDTRTHVASRDPRVISTANVYAVRALSDGSIAAMVDDKLVTLSSDGLTTRLTTTSERPLMGWSLTQEHSSALWVGSGSGLEYRPGPDFAPTRLINVMLEPEAWEFTTSRSLCIEESEAERHVLCGVHGGLIEVLPDRIEIGSPKPVLDEAKFKNATVKQSDSVFEVAAGKWSLDVTFSPRWFVDEERLEYRYRLLGFEADWTNTSSPHCAYTSLPIGEYTLEVQAYWGPSGWSEVAALVTLNVHRPAISNALRRSASHLDFRRVIESGNRRARHELEQMVRARTVELSEAQAQLLTLNQELEHLARVDSLTGVANRRSFQSTLELELAKSRRNGLPVSLIMIDIDYFKVLNDHFGHSVGDTCLQNVAWSLVRAVRDYTDVVARCGGEEFAVILPGLNLEAATVVARRIGESVRALGIAHPTSPFGVVTVSSGVACNPSTPETSMDPSELFIAADRALYRAKDAGRDRTEVHS